MTGRDCRGTWKYFYKFYFTPKLYPENSCAIQWRFRVIEVTKALAKSEFRLPPHLDKAVGEKSYHRKGVKKRRGGDTAG